MRPPRYGPPEETPGIPSDAALERDHAVIGQVLVDNQNIFNLEDPKDDKKVFRLADRLHIKTRASVVRSQLLFKPGDPYSARLVEESERLLRADCYFYDAWIRPVRYHDGKVDLKVTTRDVWTLNPGFNFSRSGGTNSSGAKLEDANLLGTGAALKFSYENNVDRSGSSVDLSDSHVFNSWTAVDLSYGNFSDGQTRGFNVTRPFYALDTRTAGSFAALSNTQIDPLYDLGQLVDQFQDRHELVQAYYGWSAGLQNGWVHRWTAGLTYDEHVFAPVSNINGTTNLLPADRRFIYPFIEWDLVQDNYLKLWNHDQIGAHRGLQLGADRQCAARLGGRGAGLQQQRAHHERHGQQGLSRGQLDAAAERAISPGAWRAARCENGLLDVSARYYVEQSKNWLFFSTFAGHQGLEPRPRQPDSPRRRQRAARLSAALSGRHGAGAVQRRAALLHRLVPLPAVPGGRGDLLRHGPHLGRPAARAAEPGVAQGRRFRAALRQCALRPR